MTDLICLKGYVFFCFIFDFRNVLEMIKDGNNSFTPTGPQVRFSYNYYIVNQIHSLFQNAYHNVTYREAPEF